MSTPRLIPVVPDENCRKLASPSDMRTRQTVDMQAAGRPRAVRPAGLISWTARGASRPPVRSDAAR